MTREQIMQLNTDYLNDCESEHEMNELFGYVLELQQHEQDKETCEMTAEEYRQRMIQAFHNSDCDGLIAICVLPTEKEFEHLEWLLKNHYKKETCDDCVNRQVAIDAFERFIHELGIEDAPYNYGEMALSAKNVPPVIKMQGKKPVRKTEVNDEICIQDKYDERILSRRYGNVFACNNCGRDWIACKNDIIDGYDLSYVKLRCPYCHNMINVSRNYNWD